MLCAFAEEGQTIDEPLVKAAVDELQWVEYSERIGDAPGEARASTGQYAGIGGRNLARLEILFRDQLVGEFQLAEGKTIIGRTPDNDLQIRSKFISRHHVQIVSSETESVLEDLNSTNGVFIRSQRVKHQTLADGDIIQLGEHKLLYRDMRALIGSRIVVDDDEELDFDDDAGNEEEQEREESDERAQDLLERN
jgi:general secretion pathway protein A